MGCFIIFAQRNVERISELNNDEIVELKDVMEDFEKTLLQINRFRPDRFNYLQIGNSLHRLHFHAIPRYANPRFFMNKEWIDTTFGHPLVWTRKEVSKEFILAIKKKFLSQSRI